MNEPADHRTWSTLASKPLGLDENDLVRCVGCGLCLPHCPTYRVTGSEISSPRGRIAAMRAVESGVVALDEEFARAMAQCVQCGACETACPSAVPYRRLVERSVSALRGRDQLEHRRPAVRAGEWIVLRVLLPKRRRLRFASWLMWSAQCLHLVPSRLGLPVLSAREMCERLDAPRGAPRTGAGAPDAWLFTGCVMDAWSRSVHSAALEVMRAAGAQVALPGRGGDCCGALHLHAGRRSDARALALRVIESMPGDAPVVVDSAGCGAAMKEYGSLIGTPEAEEFAARVFDFSTWVEAQRMPPLSSTGRVLVVQDPCHLRHVQRAHAAVRSVLSDAFELRETDDDGLCCGAGGAYSLVQPDLSREIRDRKVQAISRACSGLDPATVTVVSANPGCTYHLRAAGLSVRHPAELLAAAIRSEVEPDA